MATIVRIIQYYKWARELLFIFCSIVGNVQYFSTWISSSFWRLDEKGFATPFYGRSKLLQKPFRIQSCYINEVNAFYGEATLGFPHCNTFFKFKVYALPFMVLWTLLVNPWLRVSQSIYDEIASFSKCQGLEWMYYVLWYRLGLISEHVSLLLIYLHSLNQEINFCQQPTESIHGFHSMTNKSYFWKDCQQRVGN